MHRHHALVALLALLCSTLRYCNTGSAYTGGVKCCSRCHLSQSFAGASSGGARCGRLPRPSSPSIVGPASTGPTGLDVCRLAAVAEDLCKSSLAHTSQKTYKSAQKLFLEFCRECNTPALPASEQLLILFIADLSARVCYSTARTYLAAIRHLHISHGYGDPLQGCLQLDLVLKGLKRKKPRSQDSRLPITPFVLLKVKSVLDQDPHNYDNIMFWAAFCLGFFAFLRSAEFTVQSADQFDPTWHLTPKDISVDSLQKPTMMKVCIKGSKTDQTRVGMELVVGTTGNALCPIAATLAYLAIRGQDEGPLFRLQDGRPLTRETLVQRLRATLSAAGVNCSRYAGHSFRIGAATTAIMKGVPESTVQTLGRWASDSFKRYVRIPRQQLSQVTATLAADLNA